MNDGIWLTLSLLAGIVVVLFSSLNKETNLNTILFLMIFQLSLIFFSRFISQLLSNQTSKQMKKDSILFSFKITILITIIGVFLSVAMEYIQTAFFFLFKTVAWCFGVVAAPFMKWLENRKWLIELNDFKFPRVSSLLNESKGSPQNLVRKEFFQFEKFSASNGYGRNPGETLEELG